MICVACCVTTWTLNTEQLNIVNSTHSLLSIFFSLRIEFVLMYGCTAVRTRNKKKPTTTALKRFGEQKTQAHISLVDTKSVDDEKTKTKNDEVTAYWHSFSPKTDCFHIFTMTSCSAYSSRRDASTRNRILIAHSNVGMLFQQMIYEWFDRNYGRYFACACASCINGSWMNGVNDTHSHIVQIESYYWPYLSLSLCKWIVANIYRTQ